LTHERIMPETARLIGTYALASSVASQTWEREGSLSRWCESRRTARGRGVESSFRRTSYG
jgi:hypothetical protein